VFRKISFQPACFFAFDKKQEKLAKEIKFSKNRLSRAVAAVSGPIYLDARENWNFGFCRLLDKHDTPPKI
jgi:hypothetical protein